MNVKESTNRPTNFIGVSDMFGVKWKQILNFLKSSVQCFAALWPHCHYHISLSYSISYLPQFLFIFYLFFLWILSLHALNLYLLSIMKQYTRFEIRILKFWIEEVNLIFFPIFWLKCDNLHITVCYIYLFNIFKNKSFNITLNKSILTEFKNKY